jgi:hypothetical protein
MGTNAQPPPTPSPRSPNDASRATCVTPTCVTRQVTIVNPIGSLIKSYLKSRVLLEQLHRARARVKMFSPDTPYSKGANPKKQASMLQKVDKLFYKTEKVRGSPKPHRTRPCW